MSTIKHTPENDNYSHVLIVIGISIMTHILFSSLGLDVTDTAKYMASNLPISF